MSGRLGRSSHAIARETTPNPTMSAAKIATGTYPDTRLLLWEMAPEGEYIARVGGPEVAAPFRARRCASGASLPPPKRDSRGGTRVAREWGHAPRRLPRHHPQRLCPHQRTP